VKRLRLRHTTGTELSNRIDLSEKAQEGVANEKQKAAWIDLLG
jgi:hypothetical protein